MVTSDENLLFISIDSTVVGQENDRTHAGKPPQSQEHADAFAG
jgi:hypothetical protein